ncbi:MAG TPA: choice-of-anchor D domain-containing protein [Kofleriaceae bacterium]|nr:choice-of-anchor D domain-containing protein [Kofleriaceae bacterium]
MIGLGGVAVIMLALARPVAAGTFNAQPAVGVVQTTVNGTGTGSIVLHNDTATSLTAGSITAEPGCDPAVHLAPLTGFTLAAGATHPLTVMCSAAPAGMQRCDYRVRTSTGTVLLELEAVCAYAGPTGLLPDAPSVDFATVTVGATQPHTITLTNTGSAPITRLSVDTTDLAGNFTVQAPCNPDARECDAALPAVPPNGTLPLTVACTPRASGALTAQLYLTTGAGTRLAAPIALSCTAAPATVPVLSVSPGPIDVGDVELIGATAQATVHLTNTGGTDPLKLLDIQLVDAGTGAALDWSYTAHDPCTPHIPDVCALAAGQTVDLDLVFDPSALGVRDATLLINYHDTADRSISVPLHGAGSGATLELLGFGAAPPVIDFGGLPVDASAQLTVRVTNRGTRDLTDAILTLAPAGPFTAVPSTGPGPGFSVAAAATTTFTITCKPTAPGMVTADLQLSAPDVTSPPIDVTLRCAGDAAASLVATPPALLLGEVRTDTPATAMVSVASTGAPVTLDTATLVAGAAGLTASGTPATTPASLTLTASPDTDGDLTDHLLVTPSAGSALAIPVFGTAVTASYSVPPAVSLGTFCVQQPTTSRILPLVSSGSATLGLMAPALARADSPFDLTLIAPVIYPTTLAPGASASASATPKRQATKGMVTDDVIWKTDDTSAATMRTTLTATFIDNGTALAPDMLEFGDAPIHLDTHNAQQVVLQNCDVSALQLDAPQIPAPFSIDSPNFPTMLLPGETATFSVGFHPTKTGSFTKILLITSPQQASPAAPLMVTLHGTGVASGGGADAGPTPTGTSPTSFYACSGCASGTTPGTALFTLAALGLALRRRPRAPVTTGSRRCPSA